VKNSRLKQTLARSLALPFLAAALILSTFGYTSRAQAALGSLPNNPDPDRLVTNGFVRALQESATHTYIAGAFTLVGPYIGNAATFDRTSRALDHQFPIVAGTVEAMVPDGSGGWYIGGSFTSVDDQARQNIAHVLSDNSVDTAFNPGVDSSVYELLLDGTTLYVGGEFSSIASQSRSFIAALDVTTGAATAWAPEADAAVREFAKVGSTVYAGGEFNTIGGQTRNYIAALDATTGLATAWDPNADSFVYSLAVGSGVLYVGGDYGSIGGQSRPGLAAISTTTGLATSWDVGTGGLIYDMQLDGSLLYVGGIFSSIGGASRNNIAAVSISTALASSWNPNADSQVHSVFSDGGTIYAGGLFTRVGGNQHNRAAAISKSTAVPATWDVQAGGSVKTFALSGERIAMGGEFTFVEGVERGNGAAFEKSTGQLVAWNPGADASIEDMKLDGSTMYIAGGFLSIGGQSRNGLAAVDATTALATSWNVGVGAGVLELAVDGTSVYVGGAFTTIGGQSRNRIAQIDKTTAVVSSWNPNANDSILGLVLTGSTVYAAGNFTTIGGATRTRIAELSKATGLATSWNPAANAPVQSLTLSGTTMYAVGNFTAIGGQFRNRIAALGTTTGLASSWNPNADEVVYSLVLDGNTAYIAGGFDVVGGATRTRLAAIDTTTGTATSWNVSSTHPATELLVGSDDSLHVAYETGGLGDYRHGWGYARFVLPALEFSSASASVAEGATVVDAPVDLSTRSYDATTASFAVTGGTATAGQDFTVGGSGLTIPILDSGVTIPITIINDNTPEPTETITLTLSNPSANVVLGSTVSYTLTITDSDSLAPDLIERIPGSTPAEQALNLSRKRFAQNGSAGCGIITRNDLEVDTFVIGPLGNLQNCTLLLTNPSSLDTEVLTELNRALGNTGKKIYLAGGVVALAPSVHDTLAAAGYSDILRFDGTNRRHTARLIADEIVRKNASPATKVAITEDTAFADAFSISAVVGRADDHVVEPIMINKRRSSVVDVHLASFLKDHPEITNAELIGGTTALPSGFSAALAKAFPSLVQVRLAGANRFDTNIAVISAHFTAPTDLVVARGDSGGIVGATSVSVASSGQLFSALLAGSFAAGLEVPFVIVTPDSISDVASAYISANASTLQHAYIVGSLSQIGQSVEDTLRSIL
jgi:putative cell wall-binding protein